MKRILFLIPVAFLALVLAGCPSSNSPSSPPVATATPTFTSTATPSLPSQSVTITTTGLSPYGIRYASGGYLWVTDVSNNQLQKWTTAGASAQTITTYNGGATFYTPIGLSIGPSNGYIYVADSNNQKIEVFTPGGSYITYFGVPQFTSSVQGVAVNSTGTTVFGNTYSPAGDLVFSITPGPIYTYQTTIGTSGAGTLNFGQCESFDSQGNLWVPDFQNKRVVEFDGSGVYQSAVTLANNGKPSDVAIDGSGNLFVLDYTNYQIQEFNSAGQHLYNFAGSLGQPKGLTLDDTGTYLYVADGGKGQIAVFKVH